MIPPLSDRGFPFRIVFIRFLFNKRDPVFLPHPLASDVVILKNRIRPRVAGAERAVDSDGNGFTEYGTRPRALQRLLDKIGLARGVSGPVVWKLVFQPELQSFIFPRRVAASVQIIPEGKIIVPLFAAVLHDVDVVRTGVFLFSGDYEQYVPRNILF